MVSLSTSASGSSPSSGESSVPIKPVNTARLDIVLRFRLFVRYTMHSQTYAWDS